MQALSPSQQLAYTHIAGLLAGQAGGLIITGKAGTGKSTLLKTVLGDLPKIHKMNKLLDSNYKPKDIVWCATTNKAAENLSSILDVDVSTFHSTFGLSVFTDYKTGQTAVKKTKNSTTLYNSVVIIDEAGYMDPVELKYLFQLTVNCVFVFIGDPYQLTPIKCNSTPALNMSTFQKVELTEVHRQNGDSPILDLAEIFREGVVTGTWRRPSIDGDVIRHVSRDEFNHLISQEFSRDSWKPKDSHILAYTNNTVIAYNSAIANMRKGTSEFQEKDFAVCNSFVSAIPSGGEMEGKGMGTLKTDRQVIISSISAPTSFYGVSGRIFTFERRLEEYFVPDNLAQVKMMIKHHRTMEDFVAVKFLTDCCLDLRWPYAVTVNKAQGSTFDTVFIDLDDIWKVNGFSRLSRMLYTAVTRPKNKIILTGNV